MATELRLDFVCPKTKDDFVSSGEGLFCTECQKPVLDFTGKKQPEIVRALRRYDEMPCVWIPTDALREPTRINRPWWKTVPKSAALLGLFLLLGDVKALFAQTLAPDKPGDKEKMAPQGHQVILFTGSITDQNGKGIPDAELRFSFLSEQLGYGRTEEDGSYRIYLENYGGIREVDIAVGAIGYQRRTFDNVSVTKPDPTFYTELTRMPEPSYPTHTMIAGGIGFIQFTHFNLGYPLFAAWYSPQPAVDIFGHPPVRFDTENLEYLDEKLSYRALITDMQGNAIPGARVRMRFAGNPMREGFADANGLLRMNMQLETPALYAHIVISAPGYYNKTIPCYEFDKENIEHKLIKRPVEKPEEPTHTAAEPTPALPETAEREPETAPSAASIWVYPNPSNGTVNISLPESDRTSTIQLIDEYGRVVLLKSSYGQASVTLDTRHLPAGAHTVLVTCNGATYREKLLIVR